MMTDQSVSIGAYLKQGRLKQRLTTSDCAKRTHVAQRFIEALEEENWSILPSESHRMGFLKIYGRFLGLPSEELTQLYQKTTGLKKEPPPQNADAASSKKTAHAQYTGWFPTSWAQLAALSIALLALCWALFHMFYHAVPEVHTTSMVRWQQTRPARLVPPKNVTSVQHIRLTAQLDSWLRVTQQNRLLFEGILPAGTTKEWSGSGPFHFKFSNTKAVAVWWNDQSINVQSGSRSGYNELQLPLPK